MEHNNISAAASPTPAPRNSRGPAPFNIPDSEAFSKNWSWEFEVPELNEGQHAILHATLGADDLASLSAGGVALELGPRGPYGGGTYETREGSAAIAPGVYKANLTYSNISLPEGMVNAAILDYSIWVEVVDESTGSTSSYVPEEVESEPIDDEDEGWDEPCGEDYTSSYPSSSCPCPEEEDNGEGNNGESSSNPCESNAGGEAPGTYGLRQGARSAASAMAGSRVSSSAGKRVTARGGLQDMRWSCNFSSFRGMPGLPDGYLTIQGREANAALWSPASLCFDHPMESEVRFADAGAGLKTSSAFQIVQGSRKINAYCYGDGSEASLIAGSAKRGGSINCHIGSGSSVTKGSSDHAVDVSDSSEGVSIARASQNPTTGSSIKFQSRNGGISLFQGDTAAELKTITSYTAKNGRVYNKSDMGSWLNVVRNQEGVIQQVWNAWDGLMNIENVTDTGYRMAFYTPQQTGEADSSTGLYATSGDPFRTVEIAGDPATGVLSITESAQGRTPYSLRFWQRAGGAWCMARGEGEEALVTSVDKQPLSDTAYRLITTVQRGENGAPVSCLCETWEQGRSGHLCTSRIEGYGSDEARETLYEYDSEGRKVKETAPDGSVRTWAYDAFGRETVRMEPWAGGGSKATYTDYRYPRESDPDIASQRVVLTASATELKRTDYAYQEQDDIRRVEKTTTALGAADARHEITETWLGTAATLQQGRLRMQQGMDGVQTWYDYAYCSDHGALYKVTAETRADGATVPGHSRRRVTYISAAGNNVRQENWMLLSDGTWAQLEGETYSYDSENRWTLRTRDNGRTTQREMMCCGPLRVQDEDGITYTYAYNSARQQVESIRSEVRHGESTVTPETITTYTWDAEGRITAIRTDTGAMSATRTWSYDLCGRTVSTTDALGRTTTMAYSRDGLTTTTTTPAGATLILQRHADGSLQHQSGTGQRELHYAYDLHATGLRTTTRLADGTTILSQTIANGYGEILVSSTASTTGFIYTRSTYNTRGQLVKRHLDTGSGTASTAPTLWEYDSFGNLTRQTLRLANPPTAANSAITSYTYTATEEEDGVYLATTTTRNQAAGGTYSSTSATLVSALSSTLASKQVLTDARGNTSATWDEYGSGAARRRQETSPTSTHTAEQLAVDGFTVATCDLAGIATTSSRHYTATGLSITHTDGRGNATTIAQDIAGRTISVTDAAGHATATTYDPNHDQPATITDAQGGTTCYKYNQRGLRTAAWGSATYPAVYRYDDADRLVSLTTFRASEESGDPSERSDGDTTTWSYHDASGLVTRKTYADGTHADTAYDAYNRPSIETDARGNTKTHSYEQARGLRLRTTYSDGSTALAYQYNHLGQLTQVTDAAGTRTLSYNEYGEQESERLTAGGVAHLISETRDAYGRSSGHTYAKGSAVQHTVSLDYGADGRLSQAAFTHGGAEKAFAYSYLPDSHLLQTLTLPNGMTLEQSYEEKRDLLTGMRYRRGATGVVERDYSYDTLSRPITRRTARQATVQNDSFSYNTRSELTGALVSGQAYRYAYDDAGNRQSAQEAAAEATAYTANPLNQYAAIQPGAGAIFHPAYDDDGNQTRLQTSTGIWEITYNAENRPVTFTRTAEDGSMTRISCTYDYLGRRATKKVETLSTDAETGQANTVTTLHQLYLYRGYLQLAACDLTRSAQPCLWLLTWDPTEALATRPLAIRKDGTWYCYGWDLTKNICEVFKSNGIIATTYAYTPYGQVSAHGAASQPFQWSSEYQDPELGLAYYSFRHYNPQDGRWISRELINETWVAARYVYAGNTPAWHIDLLGAWDPSLHRDLVAQAFDQLWHQNRFKHLRRPHRYRRSLRRGSTLPDMPINSWWSLLPPCFLYKLAVCANSHYGSDAWWHAMNPGDLTPTQIRENIISMLTDVLNNRDEYGYPDPVDLGFALHAIGDSFAHGHAARDAKGRITQYNNYWEQSSNEHTPYDKVYEENAKNVDPKLIDMQEKHYDKAKEATQKVMETMIDPSTTERDIRNLIEQTIMPHAPQLR